jgi:hypothetical protein
MRWMVPVAAPVESASGEVAGPAGRVVGGGARAGGLAVGSADLGLKWCLINP